MYYSLWTRGLKMVVFIIRAYASAIKAGNKYTFQTIPRLITLWLDIGEDTQLSQTEQFATINAEIHAAVQQTPVYKARICDLRSQGWHSSDLIRSVVECISPNHISCRPQE